MSKSEKGKAKGKKGKHAEARASAAALERSPSHLLHRALQLALDIYAGETGPGAVTQRQYAVLAAVAAAEHPTQTDLVRMTGIDRSTLADMVSRMIAKGLLGRERSAADGRANLVRLTEEGQAALGAAGPKVEQADARILAILSGGKRDAFIDALAKLARAGEVALVAEAEIAEAKPPKKAKAEKPPKPPRADGKDKKKAKKDPASKKGAAAPKAEAPFEPPRLVAPE